MICPTPHKVAYGTLAEAKRVGRRRGMGNLAGQLTPYRCPVGDHWHLTHMAAADFKRLKRKTRKAAS